MSTSTSPDAPASPPPAGPAAPSPVAAPAPEAWPTTAAPGWPSFRRYARIVYRRPFENLRDLWRLRRHVRHPLRALAERHYRGRPYLGTLEFRGGPAIRYRVGTTDRHIAWTTFLRDEYRVGRIPAGRTLGCVVDVGAQIGTFAALVAGKAARVLAFEPVPANATLLRQNVAAFPHVEVVEAAVADREGRLTLHLSENNTGGHSAFRAAGLDGGRIVEVRCVPLLAALEARGIASVDLLKLDCEGAEHVVLASLERAGLERVRAVTMEYHELAPGSAPTASGEQLAALLARNGFEVENVPAGNGTGMIHAHRP